VRHQRVAATVGVVCVAGLALAGCTGGGAKGTSTSGSGRPGSGIGAKRTQVYTFGVVGSNGKILQLEHQKPTVVAGIPGSVVQIATSNSDTYALTSEGTVWAWGAGRTGELGDGTTTDFVASPVRVRFPTGVRISSLPNPMPFDAGLAIDSRGRAWGWGDDHALCLRAAQALFPKRLPFTHVTLASGAGGHALFDSDGRVYACGEGTDGELGDGSTRSSLVPVAVIGLPRHLRVKSLESSWQDSGALMTNGSYYDWGFNEEGQLGDGTTRNRSVPVRVRLPGFAVRVSQGGSLGNNGQTLAILADGSVWAWGDGQWGQLGTGRLQDALAPVEVTSPPDVTFDQVMSGGYACYAIGRNGALWAWGRNQFGELGDATRLPIQLTPAPVGVRLTRVSSTASNVAGFYRRR